MKVMESERKPPVLVVFAKEYDVYQESKAPASESRTLGNQWSQLLNGRREPHA
ncbi:hypothetical protein [Peribacillus muralis]|uniref:hypothetical protein n=1 Tax=Peribacillus muralis TaxID=264697 RepID=UPI00366AA3D2